MVEVACYEFLAVRDITQLPIAKVSAYKLIQRNIDMTCLPQVSFSLQDPVAWACLCTSLAT